MSVYFECPGDATVGTYTVQCSVEIQSVDSPVTDSSWISAEQQGQLFAACCLLWAIYFVYKEARRILL